MTAWRSWRQVYWAWREAQIEAYRDALPRAHLLHLAEEAVRRYMGAEPQTALTEVLLASWVDEIIAERLGLPSYRAWLRAQRAAMRRAAAANADLTPPAAPPASVPAAT